MRSFHYPTNMPLVGTLLLVATVLAIFSDDLVVFLVAVSLGAGCGLAGLLTLWKRASSIRFTNILATSLLLGYALGTVVFLLGSFTFGGGVDPLENTFGLHYDQTDISVALLIVLIDSALLYALATIEKPIFSMLPERRDFTSVRTKRLIWVSTGFVVGAYAVGHLGYMGLQVSESGNISAFGAIAFLVVPVMLPLIALVIHNEVSVQWRIILSFILFAFLLFLLPLGRRVLLVSLIGIPIAFAASSKHVLRFSVRKLIKISIVAFVFFCISSVSSYFFFAMRLATEATGHDIKVSNLARGAIELLRQDPRDIGLRLVRNVAERPFILSYLAGLVAAQRSYSPLFGEELLFALKTAIPSLVLPQKTVMLPNAPEQFVHAAFGMFIFDGPNTIVTAGFDDFGLIGAMLYPIALVCVYIGIRRLVRSRLPPFLYYFLSFRLIYNLLYVEQGLAGLLTVALRDCALVTVVFLLIWKFPVLKPLRYRPSKLSRNVVEKLAGRDGV